MHVPSQTTKSVTLAGQERLDQVWSVLGLGSVSSSASSVCIYVCVRAYRINHNAGRAMGEAGTPWACKNHTPGREWELRDASGLSPATCGLGVWGPMKGEGPLVDSTGRIGGESLAVLS